jgi:NhaC family Na+:H+ antiporter
MTDQLTDKPQKNAITLVEALIPLIFLVILLSFNVIYAFGDASLAGSNQFILFLSGAVAALIGFKNKVPYKSMMNKISKNIKDTSGAIYILLMVGALSGTWLLSGIIPSMVYYGLQILHPSYFLVACVLICSLISVATGSSWTTSATIGIALIGIGSTLGFNLGMVAGAVVSGAYFGDKLSPMSDTTNLAPAMAGTDLFTHIKYMMITTIPTYVLTLIIFIILGLTQDNLGKSDINSTLESISSTFNVTPWLFIVPIVVIGLIIKKTEPLIALLIGTLLGALFAFIFQKDIVLQASGETTASGINYYKGIMNALTVATEVPTDNETLKDLFKSKGMSGMLGTIWLVLCAMVFGGVMEAIGALKKITQVLMNLFQSVFGLFASTVASCLTLNFTTSDQYLAIVVPGKMFAKAYKDKGLAPENLSRTLEDSGTVTSVLIPHNTCGAYQAGVLGVSTIEYLPYAFFNIISPFMTLIVVALNFNIKLLKPKAV